MILSRIYLYLYVTIVHCIETKLVAESFHVKRPNQSPHPIAFMEPTNHLLQIISSKCGLGTGPMWSGCARTDPEGVYAVGSNEGENDLLDGLPTVSFEEEEEEEARHVVVVVRDVVAACAACSM